MGRPQFTEIKRRRMQSLRMDESRHIRKRSRNWLGMFYSRPPSEGRHHLVDLIDELIEDYLNFDTLQAVFSGTY